MPPTPTDDPRQAARLPVTPRVRGHALERCVITAGSPTPIEFKGWRCSCGDARFLYGAVRRDAAVALHRAHVAAVRAAIKPKPKEPEAMDYAPNATIEQGKTWLRARLREGAKCPVCTQRAMAYRRTIHASMAAKLIRFYRAFGQEWGSRVELGRWGGGWVVEGASHGRSG